MNKTRLLFGAVLIPGFVMGMLLAAGQSQDKRVERSVPSEKGRPGGDDAKAQPGSSEKMSREEKLVRDAYVRLMRYQSAGRDELEAANGISNKPDDYVVFEVRNIHTGPIEEILDTPIEKLASPRNGEVLNVMPNYLQHGDGPAHARYDVEWATASGAEEGADQRTVEQILRSVEAQYADVDKYTTYEVTVRLGGKRRSYRAVALHRSIGEGQKKRSAEIIDNIATEMNTVLEDESPRVRSPWKTYVKTGLYLAVAREIRDKKKAGLPLIPRDAPLGYLPGDDLDPFAADSQQSLSAACPAKSVTVSGTLGPNDGDSVNWTVTATGASVSRYEWSGAPYQSSGTGNNPNLTFSSTTTAATTTNAHWYAYPNQECGAQSGSTYKIKCKVHFSDGDKKTGEALMVVNGWWAPGGYVDRSVARLDGFPALAADATGIWRVTGMGNLTRIIPTTKQILVPTTSQFYQKTDRHEQVHLDNWKPGNLYGDVFEPAAFYARVKDFTGSTQPELHDKITDEYNIYWSFEVDFVERNRNQDEKLAHSVSDQIAPMYLYQNCGRYP
ncbi:MAG TPA: hypothetical protein VJH03_23870 [Blastocatellia bacterium]|nr:hypothetical protein [Blastocatellia bacterium]